MKTIIEGQDIRKIFSQGENQTLALADVSISIKQGEFVSVMGPSGSGKSTLLYALSGMDTIDGGGVYLDGESLYDMDEKTISSYRRRKMGFVFQNPTMVASLDILDNILLASYEDHRKDRACLIARAKELMALVGIGGLESRKISEVSGGQLQRAAICRAVLHKPLILYGDEPTGALNSKTSEEVLDIFEDLNKSGMTIVLVTHDAKVSARASRVVFMKDGRLEADLVLEGQDYETRLGLVNERMIDLGI